MKIYTIATLTAKIPEISTPNNNSKTDAINIHIAITCLARNLSMNVALNLSKKLSSLLFFKISVLELSDFGSLKLKIRL